MIHMWPIVASAETRRVPIGLIVTLAFIACLYMHLLKVVQFDKIAVSLLIGSIAGLVFAFSGYLGIVKFKAGPFELQSEAIQGTLTKQSDQSAPTQQILQSNLDLLPALGVRVLWVNDHPETLVAHRRLLRALGMDVVVAKCTSDAIKEIEHGGDFALIIQDNIRKGDKDDSRKLIKWLGPAGPEQQSKLDAPLIVFSFDPHDPTSGVAKHDWIIKDFQHLMARVMEAVRLLPLRSLPPGPKDPRV